MPADVVTSLGSVRHVHCVGVAGMGVGPLAIYLAALGLRVTGEDAAVSQEMRAVLERGGVELDTAAAGASDLVTYSSAVPASHPTLAAARARGARLLRRGALLAAVVRDRRLVAICGSHGKTTTTAMLITALRRAGFPTGYILGGLFADDAPPAAAGTNDWVVAEIDESDGTIEEFSPEITVEVNLDWDHPDQYTSIQDLDTAFARLRSRTRGVVLAPVRALAHAGGTENSTALAETGRARRVSFGPGGDFAANILGTGASAGGLRLRLSGEFPQREIAVRAQGAFNASNANAALAAAQLMGAAIPAEALAEYPGVRRRQTILRDEPGLTVLEDYAHHPTEIRALLSSLRESLIGGSGGPRRLVVIFQPHRYSRTAQFAGDFASALAAADRVYLLPVYSAGENLVAGGTTEDLLSAAAAVGVAGSGRFTLAANDIALFDALNLERRPGDVLAFVGAGDIDRKARAWLRTLNGKKQVADPVWDLYIAEVRPLLEPATRLVREEPLAAKTTLRVGGAARLYTEPAGEADLAALLRAAAAFDINVYMLGRGSNLVVPDEGVDGLVVALTGPAWSVFSPQADGTVQVGAGLRLKNLCGLAQKAGLVGFEFLEGIPGSVGGALRMNAGAMGGWMFDVVEEVRTLSLAGEPRTFRKDELHIDYRHCAELEQAIAVAATLRPAAQADATAIQRQIEGYRKKRQESQPREPSAGCIFKNPQGDSAGRLIDSAGLKGTRVGDAEVSSVHANFIVNRGAATGADVLELVRRVRAGVRAAHGVDLEPEVLLYGKSWTDVL